MGLRFIPRSRDKCFRGLEMIVFSEGLAQLAGRRGRDAIRNLMSPAVANGVVCIASNDSNIYALKASTGVKLWSHLTGNSIHSSPAVTNGMVYLVPVSGRDPG